MSGDVAVGDVVARATYPVERINLVMYAGASGDFNPIHWNSRVARAAGLPDVIAHGMFTMGAAAECVGAWCGDPGRIVQYGTKFVGMVVVPREEGATVHVTGKVTKADEASGQVTVELTVTCEGRKVLGRALAVVDLAPAGE